MLADQKKKRLNKNKVFMSAMLVTGKNGANRAKMDSDEDLEDLDVEEIRELYK